MNPSLRDEIQNGEETMISGDSTNLTRLLADEYGTTATENSVDVTITSPPYADLKTYEADPHTQIGIEESYEEYLSNLKGVFEGVHHLTKDTGTLWVVVNSFKEDRRMIDLPGDIIDICTSANNPEYCTECETQGLTVPIESSADGAAQVCPNCGASFDGNGWLLQDIVIWDKVRALPYSSKGSFRNVFEYVLCFSKTKEFNFDLDRIRNPDPEDLKEWWVNYPERYHPRGKLPDNIWSMVTPSQGAFADTSVDHPAPFPPQLVERILDLTTTETDVVMDPFAGSGTVCAQATAMDRHAVGVELSDVYRERYEELKAEIAQKWESRIESNEAIKEQQEEFKRVISGLRQIRYCRELIRSISKHYDAPAGKLGIEYLLHRSNSIGNPTADPKSFINMEIELLYNEQDLPESFPQFNERVETLMGESPCNSFGIDASVELTPMSEKKFSLDRSRLFDGRDSDRRGYLYTGGTHNEYEQRGELESLVEKAAPHATNKATYPPFISTVGVEVPHPNKICMECEEYTYSVTYATDGDESIPVPQAE